MRILIIILLVCLTACSRSSSPEGRLTIKIEDLQKEIDSIRIENKQIMDSLQALKNEISKLK